MIVGHDGAWLAGAKGAFPGLVMPGTILIVCPGIGLVIDEEAELIEFETGDN